MSDQPETLDLRSVPITEIQQAKLKELFPEVFTEGGKIDFDRLKRTLGETVDPGKERFGLTWPGKADCFKTIQQPSSATLRPVREESVDFDTTSNLIIEGDNLEVLKLLQKSYLGKVKMIYIDPPYNTGNDFIYPDNYTESLDTYLEYTGQVDGEGRKYGNNTEADGRFHSKWLNMMYPRLFLARNLLRDDGLIIMSIDDSEVQNLRRLCDEIYGEECFLGIIIIQSNKRGQTYLEIAKTHEYLLVYSKSPGCILNELQKADSSLPYSDSEGPFDLWELRNRNPKFGRFNRPNLFFPIYVSKSKRDINGYAKVGLIKDDDYSIEAIPRNSEGIDGCWRWGVDKIKTSDLASDNAILVAKQRRDGGWNIYEKSRKSTTKIKSLITDNDVISEQGTVELGALNLGKQFEHPKPLGLIKRCVELGINSNDIILDFFAGSGTTAHAVLDLNKQDGGNRKFILVQLPEPTGRDDYKTIADITKERVRRVIKKLNDEDAGKFELDDTAKQDRGFKVFKLDRSNFKAWQADVPRGDTAALSKQLDLQVDVIAEGRSDDDLLAELLLKSGFPLTTPVETLTLAGKPVYAVEQGAMLVCLDRELTPEVIQAMAARSPVRVLCLDAGFAGNDQLKTNAVQQMRAAGVTKFMTV